jgi:hypothetical protein
MTVITDGVRYLERPQSSGLADVVDLILDKGLVIDAFVRVSLLGLELLTIDARIVVASVDTYLRFAEAVDRVQLGREPVSGAASLLDGLTGNGAGRQVRKAGERLSESLPSAGGLAEADRGGDGRSRER